MLIVMTYRVSKEGLQKAREFYPAHRARLDEFHASGKLLLAGPLADPSQGALGIFTSKEAAEDFIAGDPFITGGVVASWDLTEWGEVLSGH